METIICNYDLEFMHPNRASLSKLIKNYDEDIKISFLDAPSRDPDLRTFSVKASVSCEESGYFLFTDVLKKLVNKINLLDVGGSFIDNVGRGYINSLQEKQYTKYYE